MRKRPMSVGRLVSATYVAGVMASANPPDSRIVFLAFPGWTALLVEAAGDATFTSCVSSSSELSDISLNGRMIAEGISTFFSVELRLPLFSEVDMERAEDDDVALAFFAPTCPPRGLVPHGGKLLFGEVDANAWTITTAHVNNPSKHIEERCHMRPFWLCLEEILEWGQNMMLFLRLLFSRFFGVSLSTLC